MRQTEILSVARETGRVTVDALAARFEVTPQTIRRDLNELCDRGLLTRVHGGAMIAAGASNLSYEARRALGAAEKEAIGRACAAEIPPNASLFLTIGTTVEAVARALLAHRDLMVVTNNMTVANTLAANPSAEIVVTGGVLRRADAALVGEASTDVIRQFQVDIAVIGASAIDPSGVLLDYDYREVRAARAIIENARRVFLVADATKIGRTAPVRIAGFDQIDAFFTDRLTDDALRARCAELDVAVREAVA